VAFNQALKREALKVQIVTPATLTIRGLQPTRECGSHQSSAAGENERYAGSVLPEEKTKATITKLVWVKIWKDRQPE
jgi:hypothetical protein